MTDWIYKIEIIEEDRAHIFERGREYIVKHPQGGVYGKFVYIKPHSTSQNHFIFIDENKSRRLLHIHFRYYLVGRILSRLLPEKIQDDIRLNEIALFI